MRLFKRFILLFIGISTLFITQNKSVAQDRTIQEGEPTFVIHDTIASPGELLLQLDAMNFIDENGQVAAITLRIEVDTFLIDFISIQNMVLPGGWLANYNTFLHEITITYTAPFGLGFDINGKLLDLSIEYAGGFPAELEFKAGCEVTNVNLQEINGITYIDGSINKESSVGTIRQDSVVALFNQSVSMPVMAEGAGYDMVNGIELRVSYDLTQLEYLSIAESAITGIDVMNVDGILTINWEDPSFFYDFTTLDTLFYLNFNFIGDTNTSTIFLPGSRIYNNSIVVASDFIDGYINAKLLVELINQPDTAGVALGGGYYFPEENVTITSIPEVGYHFVNWTTDGDTVSTDSLYTFTKQFSNDTLTANYNPNLYKLSLIASPTEGGEVFGAGTYDYGELVTASAVPVEGYEFLYWKLGDEIVSFDFFYSFDMPHNDVILTAFFEILVLTVTATPNNPDFGTAEGGGDFYYGETVTLTAMPNENYKFVVWTEQGQVASYDPIYSFVVQSNRDLVANFQFDSECSAPVSLYSIENSETSVLLHWIPSGSEEEWDLLWGEVGFDTISEGTLVGGLAETEYFLENLDPGTLYDFYVKAICTEESKSNWAGPETFATWYVGINKRKEQLSVVVYPNPVANILFVNLPKNEILKRYRIVSALGVIQRESEKATAGQFSIELNDLTQGVYYLELLISDQIITKVIIKE